MTRARDNSNILGTSGTNGQVLTIDTAQNNGYAFENPAQYAAGKNAIINGGFDIAQRGTSITSNGNYTLDRWYGQYIGGGTVTQQTTGVPVGSRYCYRGTSTASAGGVNTYQYLETSTVAPLWGQTVTLSAKIRANGTYAGGLIMNIYKSSTIDGGPSNGTFTAVASVAIANSSLPTGTGSSNWYSATLTTTIPNDGTANSLFIAFTQTVNTPTGAYYELANVQLELGSVATAFSRAGGTLQGELAACQRYYQRISQTSQNNILQGWANGTTICDAYWRLNPMRVAPTSYDASGYTIYRPANTTSYSGGTLALYAYSDSMAQVRYTYGSSVFTPAENLIVNIAAGGYIGFNSEL